MQVMKLAAGLAIGYVLGSRAGRDKYEQIVAAARKAQHHPAVTQAQQKAKQLLGTPDAASTVPPPSVDAIPTVEPANAGARPARRRPSSTPATTTPVIDQLP